MIDKEGDWRQRSFCDTTKSSKLNTISIPSRHRPTNTAISKWEKYCFLSSNLKWIFKPDLDPLQISLSNSSRNNQQNDSKSLSWIMDNKFRCYSLADVCHGVILGMSSFCLGRQNHLLHTDSSGIASSPMQDCAPLWGSYYCLNNVRSHHSSPR